MKAISILITDDHVLLREAWASLLNADPRFNVIAECGTGEMALQIVQEMQPDVVLMDINLPGIDGIEATQKIVGISKNTNVLGISTHKQPGYARKMIRKGAKGYLSKYASHEELKKAILDVSNGKQYICNTIKSMIAEQMLNTDDTKKDVTSLTRREVEIIDYISKGFSSKEIASELYVSTKTIEVHRYNILKKLELSNSAALINYIHHSV